MPNPVPDDESATGGRVWLGATKQERQTIRRYAFLEAALDIIGETGTAGVSVRSLCRRAGLTDRYFYESFESRDALVVQLFEQVAHDVYERVAAATRGLEEPEAWARAAVRVLVDVATEDPRKGKLLLVEPLSEPSLSLAAIASVPSLTKILGLTALYRDASKRQRAMTAIGLTGMIGGLFAAWLSDNLHVSADELVEHCVGMIVGSATYPTRT